MNEQEKQVHRQRATGITMVAGLVNYLVIEVDADGQCKPMSFREGGHLGSSWAPMSTERLLRTMPQLIGEAIEDAGGPPYVPPPVQSSASPSC